MELKQAEIDAINWHVHEGYLSEEQGDDFLTDPKKGRHWLTLENAKADDL